MYKNALLFTLPILVLTLVLYACQKAPVDPPPPLAEKDFQDIVSLAGSVENPSTYETIDTLEASTSQEVVDDDIWVCTDFEVDLSQNADDFVLYASNNAEIIYPGNFLQGKFVSEGAPRIIPLKRGPATITINTLNGSPNVVETVDEVSFSSIAQATNKLIGSNNGELAANISYTREEIRSEAEIGVKMNVEYSNLTTNIKGSFDYNSSSTFNSVFVKVTQSLYSIVVDIPDPNEAFAPSVTPEQLEKYVYQGNPATYISSVNYGRIFYLLIQSTQSETEIKAAVEASFSGGLVNANGGVEVESVNSLDQVKVNGYAYGGDAGLASGALINGMEAVKTFIEKGGSINNGAPISYVVRSLDDPSIVVAANLATKYTITECENVTGGLPVFKDARQSIGAACYAVGNTGSKMAAFDGTGTAHEYVHVRYNSLVFGPFKLWQWGPDHTHPFRNIGVGAATDVKTDVHPNTYFFDPGGTKYTVYRTTNNTFYGPFDLWQFGPDNTCPFDAVGAAMNLSIGTREITCLINKAGTEYTLFESGLFSTPRSIHDFQLRNRDLPVDVPFSSVNAALRLDVAGGQRDVVAIFDGNGTKYVYWDLDRNVIVGPLEI
ncbi:MAG: thiol-activated cytolysin family protein [Bacteroidota bacterium]